jgi:hypothetical protein
MPMKNDISECDVPKTVAGAFDTGSATLNTFTITLDDLPYAGRKLVTRYDAATRRRILERMTDKMQQAGVSQLRLQYLTTSIIEILDEAKSDIPEDADPRMAKLALEQFRKGEYLTSEAYIAELEGS